MKKIFLAGISLVIFIIFFFQWYTILSIETYEMDVYIVEEEAGFNLDEDKIHFGTIPIYGSGAYREMTIQNVYEKDVKVYLSDSGNIDKFVFFEIDGGYYDFYDFVLKANETKIYKIVFRNIDTHVGDYYFGDMKIVVKKLII